MKMLTSGTSSSGWQAKQVYALAASVPAHRLGGRIPVPRIALASASPQPTQASAATERAPRHGRPQGGMGNHQPVTLDQMKHMADKQAEPLLAKLKDDPKNADLLGQIGKIYFSTHQFKEAADYLNKALEIKPKDNPTRTLLASCLYYDGDVDGALKQLDQATADDPKDANSLFNLGMIRWQGKKDTKGALEAWGRLLRTNPQLEPAKKAQVEKLMAQVREGNGATN